MFRDLNFALQLLLCVVLVAPFGIALGWRDKRLQTKLVHEALEETAENLIAIEQAYDRGTHVQPKLSLVKVHTLRRRACQSGGMYGPNFTIIDPAVLAHADSLLRSGREPSCSDDPEGAQAALQQFVESSQRFVLEAGRRYPSHPSAR